MDEPLTLPTFEQVFNHRRGHRFGYWKFQEKLNEWAIENTKALRLLGVNNAPDSVGSIIDTFDTLHSSALELFITDYAGWATLHIVSEKEPIRNLDELEKRLKEVSIAAADGTDCSGIIRHTLASDIFVELSRTHFILMHGRLLHESAMIGKLDHVPDGKNYKVLWSLENGGSFFTTTGSPGAEKKPIMSYTQSEIIALIFHLTERLDSLTIDAVDELRHILLLLYTRNSVFFCQRTSIDILNHPSGRNGTIPSREYMVFCSIYYHALYRRIYMYDTCVKKRVPKAKTDPLRGSVFASPAARLQHFVEHEIKIASETFEEEYKKACEEAYIFPGDLEWFKYQNPDIPPQLGSILDCYRKDMAKKYYTTYRITQDVVMAAVQQPTHSGHASRIFIINLLDQYFKIHYKIPWKDGVVIKNAGIESNEKKLFSKKSAPFLVQVCSRLWVYCNKVVYMTDDIYEAIAYWAHLLKEHYDGKLFGIDLNGFIQICNGA